MNPFKSLCFGMCAVIIAGCNVVYSTKPMGEKAVSISTEEWKGTWIHSDGALTVTVIDSVRGILKVAWVETEGKELMFELSEAYLGESGAWLFVSVPDNDNPDKTQFLWGRVKKDDNQVIIWWPDVSEFKVLVENGALPGIAESDGNVVLGDLTSEHLKLITSSAKGALLDWEKPFVLIRLSK